MCRMSLNLGASTSRNPQGLSRPAMGLLYSLSVCIQCVTDTYFSTLLIMCSETRTTNPFLHGVLRIGPTAPNNNNFHFTRKTTPDHTPRLAAGAALIFSDKPWYFYCTLRKVPEDATTQRPVTTEPLHSRCSPFFYYYNSCRLRCYIPVYTRLLKQPKNAPYL